MSLWGPVMINRDVIGYWSARRIRPEINDVNTYEWQWGTQEEVLHSGKLEHRYEDGAAALASAVLAEIAKIQNSS